MHMTTGEAFVGCLAGNLRAATRAVTRSYDAALRPYGMRITQVAVLAQLRGREPVGLTALATVLGAERSGVARDVALLERNGLVTTTVSAQDQRVRTVSLTLAGNTKLRACAPAWRAAQEQMRLLLGAATVDELVAISSRVADALTGP